jgi:hypothetical protein
MRLSYVIAGLTVATFSATAALAQPAPPPPPSPPPTDAPADADTSRDDMIQQTLVNPRGQIDGLLLRDGTVVRFSPYALAEAARLRPGASVHVTGTPVVNAGVLTLFDARVTQGATTIVDAQAPPPLPGPGAEPSFMLVSGPVAHVLSNRNGIADGVILADGTVVVIGPGELERADAHVTIGTQLTARGVGSVSPAGRTLAAEQVVIGDNVPLIAQPQPQQPEQEPPPPTT